MDFLNFFRGLFVFDWLFGNHRKGGTLTNHTKLTDYNNDCECGHDHDDYMPPRSNISHSSWDDGHYANDDYYHDSHDDYAHDFDDFEDDY